ncbi:hypothetical protein MIND_01422100 [Mycena indigotica]|uniref:Uncharacterized protein n=1 Tax=Mycena indigotica TaxID=2126181 RepID=A0A8H6RY68_9AGAR|nr:uncharacterized protein MIND_01422100 [Mycena indigotica]KAF7288765.1 hypothetical protein MIND_01422100 [Mycena indigotica]
MDGFENGEQPLRLLPFSLPRLATEARERNVLDLKLFEVEVLEDIFGSSRVALDRYCTARSKGLMSREHSRRRCCSTCVFGSHIRSQTEPAVLESEINIPPPPFITSITMSLPIHSRLPRPKMEVASGLCLLRLLPLSSIDAGRLPARAIRGFSLPRGRAVSYEAAGMMAAKARGRYMGKRFLPGSPSPLCTLPSLYCPRFLQMPVLARIGEITAFAARPARV